MNDYKNILSHSDCLTKEQMQAYLSNQLDKQAMHAVESHLTDCMFCSDAIEGLQILSADVNEKYIDDIQSSIEQSLGLDTNFEKPFPLALENTNSVEDLKVEKTASQLKAKKGGKRISWVAAAGLFFLIFASGLVVFSYINNNTDWLHQDGLAKNTPATKEIKLNENKTSGRELETYTLDSDDLAASESVNEIDENSTVKNNIQQKETVNSTNTTKSIGIVARNDDRMSAAPPAQPQLSEKRKEIEETRMLLNEKEKRDEKNLSAVIAKTDKEAQADFDSPSMAGARNTYSQPLYDGKMKDINNAPAVTQSESKKVQKSSSYSKVAESAREIDAIQSQGLSKKNVNKVSLSYYEQGLTAFNMANYKESIKYLKRALKEKDLNNRQETLYYLAQAYEKTNDITKARELYNELSKSKVYENRAKTRLREMPAK